MDSVVSCGVVIVTPEHEVFVCRATGRGRWDLPKGMPEPGESARDAAVRELGEETSLRFDPRLLEDLGVFDYLPHKKLHLFGLCVPAHALDLTACLCTSTFVDPVSGRTLPEVDGYAWKPIARLEDWCGKNLGRVLGRIDWSRLRPHGCTP